MRLESRIWCNAKQPGLLSALVSTLDPGLGLGKSMWNITGALRNSTMLFTLFGSGHGIVPWPMRTIRGQLVGLSSLLPSCGSWWSNSGSQAWLQISLDTESLFPAQEILSCLKNHNLVPKCKLFHLVWYMEFSAFLFFSSVLFFSFFFEIPFQLSFKSLALSLISNELSLLPGVSLPEGNELPTVQCQAPEGGCRMC